MIYGDQVKPASSFPAVLEPRLDEMVGRFGCDPFPLFILLSDGVGGFGFYRWKDSDADLEELATSALAWPAVLAAIAADGRGQCVKLQIEERGWLQ